MGQLAVVLLALFGQMERTYAVERAAPARVPAATSPTPHRRPARPADISPLRAGTSFRIAPISPSSGC
ncbi:hypothetical protein [Rhodococcus pseudokoreensis]|uniref:hypothetical protein n=1 Tax=Rhodococcus pseudokoreensis TaxID=2811421 RepID=UPI003B846D81